MHTSKLKTGLIGVILMKITIRTNLFQLLAIWNKLFFYPIKMSILIFKSHWHLTLIFDNVLKVKLKVLLFFFFNTHWEKVVCTNENCSLGSLFWG